MPAMHVHGKAIAIMAAESSKRVTTPRSIATIITVLIGMCVIVNAACGAYIASKSAAKA